MVSVTRASGYVRLIRGYVTVILRCVEVTMGYVGVAGCSGVTPCTALGYNPIQWQAG